MNFEQSESIAEITKALLAFHREVGKVKKGSDNPFFKSKYAALPDILDAISAPLEKSELVVVQFPAASGLTTQVSHVSGEWMRSTYEVSPKEANNPQSLGSAITYARRYALAAALSLNVDEDDDGNAASGRVSHPVSRPSIPAHTAQEDVSAVFDEQPTVNGANWRSVTVQSVEEKEGQKGKFLRLSTNLGWASVFDTKLFDLIHEGDMEVVMEKRGNFTNIVAVR